MKGQGIKNYELDWKKAEAFIDKGLPASALEIVKQIQKKAIAEKQEAQLVKALVYLTAYQTENREDNELISIKEIEHAIGTSKQPVTNLLNSYLAGLYEEYFNQNRYRIYSRTNTVSFKKEDPATWSIDDFTKKISALYLASLKDEKLLQQTSLAPYDALIQKGNMRALRPTLYDLLAHRALEYFNNSERDITKPAYQFEISQIEAFAPANIFSNFMFETKDSLSLHHKALLIYQGLIRFHLKDENPDALIDLNISRLQFASEHSVLPNKDQLFYQALEKITKQYSENPFAAQAGYLMAQWHRQQAEELKKQHTRENNELLKAVNLLEPIIKTKGKSEGKANAENLLHEIKQPSINFQVEKVNIPDQPFRIFVEYKNTNKVFIRIIKATEQLKDALAGGQYKNDYWTKITNAEPFRTWEQKIPASLNYLSRSVEIKADALPVGEYYILTSLKESFNQSSNILGLTMTYISNISFVNNSKDFFVLDRNSGQPLANATVQTWTRKYNYSSSKYIREKFEKYSTDKNGYFLFPAFTKQGEERNSSNRNFIFEINHKNDHLFIDEDIYNYYYYNDYQQKKKQEKQVFLFSDRSIYRPGQTLYFKGILLSKQTDGTKAEIIPNHKTIVTLYDANQQKVDSLTLTSNEYGSFNGKFQLPIGILNGSFTLRTKEGNTVLVIKVEEYKRPKFYVDFEKPKGTFKVNDEIELTGNAKAYAGNSITGAMVKYRVVREARFLYPWLFWRGWWPQVTPLEIIHGEAETDANGNFNIKFKAIPDLKIDKKTEPIFDYVVYSDVTDINGETRSGTMRVAVGYKSLILNANVPDRLETDKLKSIGIKTQNMAGQFEKANVQLKMFKLKAEQRLLRNRYWPMPDTFVMNKEEYIGYFPNDIYADENDPKTWQKEEQVLTQQITTDSTGNVSLNKKSFNPGFYVIEITTQDKEGNEVKDIRFIKLFDAKENKPSSPEYLMVKNPEPIEPGGATTIGITTSAPNVFLIKGQGKDDIQYSFYTLNNNSKQFSFSATEADRGGYGVSYLFVKNNRVFSNNNAIMVPWSNKELKIEYNTFRDKTLPGAEEKWSVKVSGLKGEKVAAEMLAAMYDASLDQFYAHQWDMPSIWYNFYNQFSWNGNTNFSSLRSNENNSFNYTYKSFEKDYDALIFEQIPKVRESSIMMRSARINEVMETAPPEAGAKFAAPAMAKMKKNEFGDKADIDNSTISDTVNVQTETSTQSSETQIRKNFNETAFFFPDLKTDKEGNISFSFTMPEALTRWKFQALSHTKDLAFGYSSKDIITQKDLMVQPNPPRFLREGDKLDFSAKLVNLSNQEVTGIATLQLFDPATNEVVDGWFKNIIPQQFFTLGAKQSQAIQFPLEIPYQYAEALTWRIVAKVTKPSAATNLSDGEENILPVLTNRMLVTESMPLTMRGSGEKNFTFDKLLKSAGSETLTTQSLSVEYTSNPAWYAVQALPYMMEYPYDCAEQTWNRYYANSLATLIANSSPKIKAVFEKWKTEDTAALVSNLHKNQELKSVLLEATPWVLQAKSETEQKKNIAVLFDLVRMSSELNKAFEKLKQQQSSNGGFVWFKGGPDDRYITQYILTGIGHLQKINAIEKSQEKNLNSIVTGAIPYLDRKINETYQDLIKNKTDLKKFIPSYFEIQYLYMRSFFPDIKINTASQKAVDYFTKRAKESWTTQNKYMQGMIALALHRNKDLNTPKAILKSLKETAINNEELGMYYKDAARSWWWYQAPIERQALLIEAFEEIAMDKKTADDLRTWLLKNKQTNNWESTKATAEACYALLLQGTKWLSVSPDVKIKLGNTNLHFSDEKTEVGTGYYKKTITANKVNPTMGNIQVEVKQADAKSTLPTWGAVYWQYFEDLDKISFAETPLKLNKKLFVETYSDRGPVLTPINENDQIKIGDKIKVRVELRVDRDMEYVHMRDMRASGFEPVNVLSEYKWQGGLGYYETTKDASTDFFFSYLPKGTYVFEYALFASVAGNFSNGITTIQCMYAPEFTSHSEGIRVRIK